MAIEFITPDLVMINGRAAEIRDGRMPDMFDELADRDNMALQNAYASPLQDFEIDLRQGYISLASFDPELAAYQQIPRFVDLARRAAIERGISYRGFRVGASACAFSVRTGRLGYFFGANYTPYKGAPKHCAELDVLDNVNTRGFDRILALAVFGPSDFGDVNSVASRTLHPCGQCRTMLDNDSTVSDHTLLITGNEYGDIELMFIRDLIELHQAGGS